MAKADLRAEVPDAPASDGAPELKPAKGYHYKEFLFQIHQSLKPEWYLEVGTNVGGSLQLAECKCIAVDPVFRVDTRALHRKEQIHIFTQSSDDFFASGVAEKLTSKIDVVFLDGLHLFEFLLRDFINAEKLCGSNSLIALHDLIPPSYPAANREWVREETAMWTGDVWKLAFVLRKYRPDLDFSTADCWPSGLGLITNLDPENKALSDAYDEIIAEYQDLDLASFSAEDLEQAIGRLPAKDASFDRFAGRARKPLVRKTLE